MMQPTGMAVLSELGLNSRVDALGARIDRLTGEANGRTVLDVSYSALRGERHGIGIHRAALFAVLHDAVAADGIPTETGRSVTGADAGRLAFEGGRSAGPFDLIVDALGARSALAPETGRALAHGALWAALDWRPGFDGAALQQRYRRASVMAGVMPIGLAPGSSTPQAAFFWSLRADRLDAWRNAGLTPWKSEVAALWPATRPLLDQITDPAQLTFARYSHRTLAAPAARGLIHLGDSWHSTSPQLGQGANMALLDAWALAKALREADDLGDALARAVAMRRRHVRLYQAMSLAFTPVYQSDGQALPFVRDRLVGPLSKLWPATALQAAMVSGLAGSPLRRLGLR